MPTGYSYFAGAGWSWVAGAGAAEVEASVSRSFFRRLISTRPPLVRLVLASSRVGALYRSVAHADHVNPVNRNLMVEHEVTNHCVRHLL